MVATLQTTKIAHNNGTDALTVSTDGTITTDKHIIPPAGAIIQIQYDQLTTETTSQAFSASTAAVVSNFPTVNITPNKTSSKIKIDVSMMFEFGASGSQHNHMFFLYRDSTRIGYTGTATSTWYGIAMATNTYTETGNDASTPNQLHLHFFDSPNTTDEITYKLGFISNNAQTLYINRTVASNNAANYERGISFISATEIAG